MRWCPLFVVARGRPSDKVGAPRRSIVIGNRVYVVVISYEGILTMVIDVVKDLVSLKQAPCINGLSSKTSHPAP